MRIFLDGEEYTVPAEQEAKMLEQFHTMSTAMYEKQGLELQLLVTAVVRWVLSKWETAVRKTQGKEASLLIRPPKKVEPAIHLSSLLVGQMGELVRNAELRIETDGYRTTTKFVLSLKRQDQEGRPMVFDGNERERENDGVKIS